MTDPIESPAESAPEMRARSPIACSALALLASVAAAVPALSASSPVRFRGAGGSAQVRPATLLLTGDGTLTDVNVHWSSWGGRVSVGHGIADWHGCTPNCAQGEASSRPRDRAPVPDTGLRRRALLRARDHRHQSRAPIQSRVVRPLLTPWLGSGAFARRRGPRDEERL